MSEAGPKSESFDTLKGKADALARSLSHKLLSLPADDLAWQSEATDLAQVYSSNVPGGKTGAQLIFEERMASIQSQTDDRLRYHLMFNFVKDLERLHRSADFILAK